MIIPNVNDPILQKFLVELDRELTEMKRDSLRRYSANPYMLILSEGRQVAGAAVRKTFAILADNNGQLRTEEVTKEDLGQI